MNPQKGLLTQGKEQPEQKRQNQQVDPQNQEQYDVFMANGMNVLHDEKVSDQIISQIIKSQDPVESIARATVDLIIRLETSASQNGVQVADNVKMQAANQLMGEIINLAEMAGMKQLTDEERYKAFSLAVSMYLDESVKSGNITPEQLAQMGQEMQGTPEGQKIVQQMGGQQGQQANQRPMPQPGGLLRQGAQ